ncbi:hypothetical protein [Corynebacterium sphenisci]|uniref:hypothetical protein n=1 Tax=Corynebacterium sphenisci TaxID=191493 RepID=UPI0026DF52B6|nr:hypothetical protein [Corynebacterium sphenisci]MDO5731087.1 hypothetical protein [Corynebacterium sphenisci]
MTAHYDLYEALGLDRGADGAALGAEIHSRLQDLHARGVPAEAPEVQQLLAAGSILGDPDRRRAYDTRLGDASAPTMDIPALRALAATGSFPDEEETVAGPRPTGAAAPEPAQPAAPAGAASFDAAPQQPAPPAQPPFPAPQQAGYPTGGQPQPAAQAAPQQAPPQQPAGYPPAYPGGPAPAAPGALSRLLAPVPTLGRVLLGGAAAMVVIGALGLLGTIIAVFTAGGGGSSRSGSALEAMINEVSSAVGEVLIYITSLALAALFLLAVVIGAGILVRALGERTRLAPVATAVPATGLALASLIAVLISPNFWLLSAGLLLLIAGVLVAVLAFVGDSGAWLAGRPVAPKPAPAPAPAPAPQQGQYGPYAPPHGPDQGAPNGRNGQNGQHWGN